jgi:hypothetical protein
MSGEREAEISERARGAGDGSSPDRSRRRAEGFAGLFLFVVRGVAFDEERGKGWEGARMTGWKGAACARIRGGGER